MIDKWIKTAFIAVLRGFISGLCKSVFASPEAAIFPSKCIKF